MEVSCEMHRCVLFFASLFLFKGILLSTSNRAGVMEYPSPVIEEGAMGTE